MTPDYLLIVAPGVADCDFETGGLCSWTQAKDDKFNWGIGRGGTGSSGTGPSTDNTKKTSKFFLEFAYMMENNSDRKCEIIKLTLHLKSYLVP